MKQVKVFVLLALIISLFPFKTQAYYPQKEEKPTIPTPVLFVSDTNKTLLQGLCAKNTEVLIYVDGKYDGFAHVNESNTLTNNFFYFLNSNLSGRHTVKAIARDKTSLLLSLFSEPVEVYINKPDAPTLIAPQGHIGADKIIITGLVPNNTYAKIFIDGKYDGKTDFLYHPSGTANFAYRPSHTLKPGLHKIYATVKNREGQESLKSKTLTVIVENKLPAPTLKTPVINKHSSKQRPFIVGLSKNDTFVTIYIDGKQGQEFKVKNHPSKTASFAYKPNFDLGEGEHKIYAIARDKNGKTSQKSNIIIYKIKNNKNTAKTENKTIQPKQKEETTVKDEQGIIGKKAEYESKKIIENKTKDTKSANKEENKNKTKEETEGKIIASSSKNILASNTQGGIVDENNQQQNKIRLNIVVFIAFLIAVIAWIIWVNKELVKEKEEEENEEENK